MYIQVVAHDYQLVETMQYRVDLVGMDGRVHHITAVGMPAISVAGPPPDLSGIRCLFPEEADQVFNRPQGADWWSISVSVSPSSGLGMCCQVLTLTSGAPGRPSFTLHNTSEWQRLLLLLMR